MLFRSDFVDLPKPLANIAVRGTSRGDGAVQIFFQDGTLGVWGVNQGLRFGRLSGDDNPIESGKRIRWISLGDSVSGEEL